MAKRPDLTTVAVVLDKACGVPAPAAGRGIPACRHGAVDSPPVVGDGRARGRPGRRLPAAWLGS